MGLTRLLNISSYYCKLYQGVLQVTSLYFLASERNLSLLASPAGQKGSQTEVLAKHANEFTDLLVVGNKLNVLQCMTKVQHRRTGNFLLGGR